MDDDVEIINEGDEETAKDKLTKLKEYGENIETVYTIPDEKFFIIVR